METNGNIRAPSVPVTISPPFLISAVDWDGLIDLNLDTGLIWTLYDRNTGQLMYQSSEYTIGDDGNTATFKHTFPAMDNGDTYTITQEVIVT